MRVDKTIDMNQIKDKSLSAVFDHEKVYQVFVVSNVDIPVAAYSRSFSPPVVLDIYLVP